MYILLVFKTRLILKFFIFLLFLCMHDIGYLAFIRLTAILKTDEFCLIYNCFFYLLLLKSIISFWKLYYSRLEKNGNFDTQLIYNSVLYNLFLHVILFLCLGRNWNFFLTVFLYLYRRLYEKWQEKKTNRDGWLYVFSFLVLSNFLALKMNLLVSLTPSGNQQ